MLFDPLEFLGPYTMQTKVLHQEIWTAGPDWDGRLTEELVTKKDEWFKELTD